MNLLLLLYAMIAGLAGINAGPAAVARMAAVAQGTVAGEAPASSQAEIVGRALLRRGAVTRLLPAAAMPDARRVAVAAASPRIDGGRAAPERRIE